MLSNDKSVISRFCRTCKLVLPFDLDFEAKTATCPKCKTAIPMPQAGTDEYGIRTWYSPDDPPGYYYREALKVFDETGHLPIGLDLKDTKKTWVECTHCKAFADLDYFDSMGAEPGNVFCFSCGKEFSPGVHVPVRKPPMPIDQIDPIQSVIKKKRDKNPVLPGQKGMFNE